jgi:NO-binding membrane sensor protein with MHYT domain
LLFDGQSEYQLAYSSQFTILSFFVPIFVLLGAYSLAGTGSDEVQRIRVGLGGVFAGSSICGMHYLGDAGKHVPTPAVGSKMTARKARE